MCYWNQRREFEANPGLYAEERELAEDEKSLDEAQKRVERLRLLLALKKGASAT
jgi:hypothetical protein